jgi:carbon-monoxide dehydrogenase medium subunit
MSVLEYYTPSTMKEAYSLLVKHGNEARIVAGGTDLLVQMKHRELQPKYIIDIRNIPGQDTIAYDKKDGLRIGALATIHAIESSPSIRDKFGVLAVAASKLGTPQVRNQATIGGNLSNASPSAEMPPALMVLDAQAKITGIQGERTVPVDGFFLGPGQTVLNNNEILTEIQVPNLPVQSGGGYLKHTVRKALDLAMVSVAVLVTVDRGVLYDVKIALGAVAPTPIRAWRAEKVLRGQKVSEHLLQEAARTASEESVPIDDIRCSAEYRRLLVGVLVARAVKQALEKVTAA